jgi:uncharacterized membrane protein (UPF0127 family)
VCSPAGCGNSSSGVATPTLPTTPMKLGSRTYTLEIANDTAEREKGLMRRDSMASDHGMIFVFPVEQKLGFYMRNTRIPLDIVYVNAQRRVVFGQANAAVRRDDRLERRAGQVGDRVESGASRRVRVKAGDPQHCRLPPARR